MDEFKDIKKYVQDQAEEHRLFRENILEADAKAVQDIIGDAVIECSIKKLFNDAWRSAFKKPHYKKISDGVFVVGPKGIGEESGYGYIKRARYSNGDAWKRLNERHAKLMPKPDQREVAELFVKFRKAAHASLDVTQDVHLDVPVTMRRLTQENIGYDLKFFAFSEGKHKDVYHKATLKRSPNGIKIELKEKGYRYGLETTDAEINLTKVDRGLNPGTRHYDVLVDWNLIVKDPGVAEFISDWKNDLAKMMKAWEFINDKASGLTFLNLI
jgi:hypothetical protein